MPPYAVPGREIGVLDTGRIPVTSVFWHEGEFGTGEEWQLLLKTQQSRYAELEAHILKLHPWQNPEIAAVPIVAGSEACLRWLAANTTPAE
ncbi:MULTISPECIES: divalent cation tolerance protein CutA [unclassified Streptomyces]|uniref:divalent-cation tolerance protein CutA n=1 Tax=Streptomyces sp. Ag82_O1-12 TaxID=1938854 RepID=UPI000BE3B0F8|nr:MULTISPECIES: divalent cation tolerance protein CutA [unclassified Streptomyces]